jgi:protein gp37
MSLLSKIEWTDATWNPVRGCTKISPGCQHCYAERFAERFRGVKGHPFEQGFDVTLVPHKLGEPLRWSEPKMIFVNSMSDLFHESVPESYISRVAATNHIWWGVSVEDRKYGLPRIAHLQAAPAGVRFLSVEPLLEDIGKLPLDGISWVIVGGESGPGARPMKERWVLSIREQCEAANVPFFFKQWGGVRKKAAGRVLGGRTYDGFPKRAQTPPLPRAVRQQFALKVESNEFVQIGT